MGVFVRVIGMQVPPEQDSFKNDKGGIQIEISNAQIVINSENLDKLNDIIDVEISFFGNN